MNHRFKCKTIELLEENIGENLQALGVGEEFLDITPKSMIQKIKKLINYTKSKLKLL